MTHHKTILTTSTRYQLIAPWAQSSW